MGGWNLFATLSGNYNAICLAMILGGYVGRVRNALIDSATF
jgi:hypothetical protein